jgi:metal-responsive CopG/Arc/MetJ family transcriptional regulator
MTTESGTKKLAPGPVRTPVMRLPPRLLARLDALVERQPDPKPTRAKVIKNLVRQALDARDEQRAPRYAAKGAPRRA